MNLETVDVVVGAILNEGRFLAEKRKPNEPVDPGITCLPGGHVEPGETYEHALTREMREELNIGVEKAKFIRKSSWTASNGEKQNVYYYLILDYEGNPECRTAEYVFWKRNIRELDIEIDRQAVKESRVMLRREK
jgi:mutator protein MutT